MTGLADTAVIGAGVVGLAIARALALAGREVAVLEAELAAIDQRVAEVNAEIKDAKLARTRLLDFRAQIGADFQCPHCWVQSEARSTLEAVPGTDGEEILICRTCGSEYLIPE